MDNESKLEVVFSYYNYNKKDEDLQSDGGNTRNQWSNEEKFVVPTTNEEESESQSFTLKYTYINLCTFFTNVLLIYHNDSLESDV